MTQTQPLSEPAPVERRLRATRMQVETAIAVVGCLIVLVSDTQSLALIPLLPELERQYRLSPSEASWALSAGGLAGAAWAPTITRLGDRLGMRRLLLASLVLSVIGNLMSAVVDDFPLFVASRALLGLSAAGPLVYAILRARSTSAHRTSRGAGIMTVAIGLGIAVSYLMSGAIIQANGSVRTVFWVISALSVLTLLVAWLILPDSFVRSTAPIDWVGAAGVSAGLVCVVLAITEGNSWGWSSGRILGLLIGGLLIFALWSVYEARHPYPLIDVRRVINRTAAPAFVIAGLCSAMAIYTNLAEVVYLQMPKIVGYGLGESVLQVAYVLSAISVAVVLGGFITAPLITRFGPRVVVGGAGISAAAGFFFLAYSHDQVWQYVIANLLWGFAFAFAYGGATATYLIDAKPTEAAMYSSANTVIAAGIGGLGAGIFTAVLTAAPTIPKTPIPEPAVFERLFLYAGIVSIVMFALALVVRRPRFVPADAWTVAPADTASATVPTI